MTTEKIVMQQARKALRGNLSKLIAAAGLTMLAFLLVEYLEYFVGVLLGVPDIDSGEQLPFDNPAALAVALGFTAVLLLAMPLLNGFLRMAATTAVRKECASRDIFYYFRSAGLYFKTVLVDFLLYALWSLAAALLNASGILGALVPELFQVDTPFTVQHYLTVLAAVVTVLLRVILYMLLAHYPLLAYALNENRSVGQCVFGTIGFSFRHFGQLLRLMFRFIGWFALCFFVVPALYVLPYFSVASLMSARWLLELDNGGSDI